MIINPDDLEAIKQAIDRGHIYGELGVFNDAGDLAQCHICGRWFVSVAAHSWQSHGVLADQYRELFGLNYNQGLESDRERKRKKIGNYPLTYSKRLE